VSAGVPALSVVVALISGRVEDLRACLTALHRQDAPPDVEIIVPYDDYCRDVLDLSAEFASVRFLRADGLETAAARQGASREHHDTLRTVGLRAARARYVALTEDHAVASSTWCRDMVQFLDAHPDVAAAGGAVECGSTRTLNWAVYYCDFGRYQNPLSEGPASYISDSNVAYRAEALEAVADAWRDDYHETLVHSALSARGHPTWLTPRSQVWQTRSGLTWREALRERYVWGRSYAGSRTRELSGARRWIYAALAPTLPFVLTWRVVRGVFRRGRTRGRVIVALPAIVLCHACWACGEWIGYVTRRAGRSA